MCTLHQDLMAGYTFRNGSLIGQQYRLIATADLVASSRNIQLDTLQQDHPLDLQYVTNAV
jgi:hypothetical protein